MKLITKSLDYLYSIYFNFKVFPYSIAKQLPIHISHHTKIHGKLNKGCIVIHGEIKKFMISLGIDRGSFGIQHDKYSYLLLDPQSKLIFNGNASMEQAFSLKVYNHATVEFGKNVSFNVQSSIICTNHIQIGNNLLAGWYVSIRDTDGHKIYQLDDLTTPTNPSKEVMIGNHVWLGTSTSVMKGAKIADHSITAQNSCITKAFTQENVILAGIPAKIIKENTNWNY